MAILYWIPKNLLSYWVGKLMHLRFPKGLQLWLLKAFAKIYRINVEEAEFPLEGYSSVGEFFIRSLKPGVRPLGQGPYLHPADSRMTARGPIVANKLIQAKGRSYSVGQFLLDSSLDRWQKGVFVTYYLCPTDYHRVHSPVDGVIREVRYVPGNLWPVNDWSVTTIEDLFVKNERVIVEIETDRGPMAVVFVGATNVGSIRLTFEPTLQTNHAHRREERRISYVNPLPVRRGDELGMFCFGSTVIVVASAGWSGVLQGITQSSEPLAVQVCASPE